jgi:hypothetical protein
LFGCDPEAKIDFCERITRKEEEEEEEELLVLEEVVDVLRTQESEETEDLSMEFEQVRIKNGCCASEL